MASVLVRMLSGDIPSEILYQDDRYAAVMEPAPLHPGHVFVFPKSEIESWLHLEGAMMAELMDLAQRLAQAVQKATGCPRVALAAYGLKTPHVHFHLIPAWGNPGEMDLTKVRAPQDLPALRSSADQIRSALK